MRRGEIDMLLGMYHETAMYMGLEYVFPAAVNNPIVAIMLPGRIHEVKSRADLKKLRGAMSTHEHLSDFVAQELKQYNVKKFEKASTCTNACLPDKSTIFWAAVISA